MSRRSILTVLGAVAVLMLAAILMRETGTPAPPGEDGVVAIDGDTVAVRGIPLEVMALLDEGRAWRAARALRQHLKASRAPDAEAILLAARAEAEWGAWDEAREYLEEEPWLDEVWGGEGWYWLGRGRDETGADSLALAAYDRYLALTRESDRPRHAAVAELRRGVVLMRLGRTAEGAEALQAVHERAPGAAGWLTVVAAEALAQRGDTAATAAAAARVAEGGGMRHRARMADVRAWEATGDRRGALRRALAFRAAGGSATERAELSLAAARNALALDDGAGARRELLATLNVAPASAAAREAANLLLDQPGLSAQERLTIARVDERHGNNARAARGFQSWLASGSGTQASRNEVRLRLGRALFNAGELVEAEAALRSLADAQPAIAREARFLTGRAQYRRGARDQAFSTFRQLAARFPGSVEGSEGLYLVADLNHDDGNLTAAAPVYRQVADHFRGTDRAGLSLMRLAGMRYHAEDFAGAAALWEEYRSSYSSGDRWLESTYWAGRAYESLGNRARAEGLYGAIRTRDPLSYYALRASERLGLPYWPIPMSAAPPVDPAAEERVAVWMTTVDLLRDAGLHREADAEAQRIAEAAPSDPAVLYSLAEALNERGYAIRGIRVGQRLERASTTMNPRLLRLLYPFPYRSLIEAEAREAGLDPFIVAALTRQESLFTQRISSPVGARGLMQIMPETGRALARGAGIAEWDPEILFHPEINVHLGIAYLAEQMRRYDGSLPSVFSAYNAGPHRIDVWKQFPEYEDEELFTERIPFRETRDYVKILTRNIALYRGLYGEDTGEPATVEVSAR